MSLSSGLRTIWRRRQGILPGRASPWTSSSAMSLSRPRITWISMSASICFPWLFGELQKLLKRRRPDQHPPPETHYGQPSFPDPAAEGALADSKLRSGSLNVSKHQKHLLGAIEDNVTKWTHLDLGMARSDTGRRTHALAPCP